MKGDDILAALDDVGKKWTRQVKAEERRPRARQQRESMWSYARTSLKEICYAHMAEAWAQASDNGRLPTHWRQVFYVIRPLCDSHPDTDRPLIDSTFKGILESYLEEHAPGWDVLRGARGVFKEPHRSKDDSGLAMSTMNVRNYLSGGTPSARLETIAPRFPTRGARNRIAAVLICEKEGFDELLQAERIPERYDLALMSTKGISAIAARDLAASLDVPTFTLHDMDKNGFVMAAGFPDATDLGIRMDDVHEWDLTAEDQHHKNRWRTWENLIRNGATFEEADFIADGRRVELNMLTGPDFIEFVTRKLDLHHVEKVIPDGATLEQAWRRAHCASRVNQLIRRTWTEEDPSLDSDDEHQLQNVPATPDDLREQIRAELDADPVQSWDEALWVIAGGSEADDDDWDDEDA